jgi:hypothetical protein
MILIFVYLFKAAIEVAIAIAILPATAKLSLKLSKVALPLCNWSVTTCSKRAIKISNR